MNLLFQMLNLTAKLMALLEAQNCSSGRDVPSFLQNQKFRKILAV
jgi:hypothetical protein